METDATRVDETLDGHAGNLVERDSGATFPLILRHPLIDKYSIRDAVADGAVVPLIHEGRAGLAGVEVSRNRYVIMNRIPAGEGEIETIKIGAITLVPMAALETFLERQKLASR